MDLRKISGSPPDAFFKPPSGRTAAPRALYCSFPITGAWRFPILPAHTKNNGPDWVVKKCKAFVRAGILHSEFHQALYFSFSIQFRSSALYFVGEIIILL
jgi:hypothetical protein